MNEVRKIPVIDGHKIKFKAWRSHYKSGGTVPDGIGQAKKDLLILAIENFSHYIPTGKTVNAEQFADIIERSNKSAQAAEICEVLRSL